MKAVLRSFLLLLLVTFGIASGQTPWVASARVGNEARFLFGGSIARYDLAAKSWLTPYTLSQSGAVAMAADSAGGVIAYGSSVFRCGADFSGQTLLGTTSSAIQSVFLDGNLVIAVHSTGLYSRITIFDRSSGSVLSTNETYVDSSYGVSHAPVSNRLFGRTQGISPADIVTSSYTDAGVVSGSTDSPYHGSYPYAAQTWVFPDETRVVDSSGTVYTNPGLSYFGSLAGTVTDIAFNGDVPIVLRGAELISFTSTLNEAGRGAAGATAGQKLYVTSSEAFVFSPSASATPAVNIVPLSSIQAPEPGTATDPNGLAYTIDQAFPDKDGNLILFSKAQLSLFRWSPATQQYTASIPLVGIPKFAAYSKENNAAYFAYENQIIRQMDLGASSPKETPFVSLPMTPNGLWTAGQFVFASDSSGAWDTHYYFDPSGAKASSADWNYYSRVWEWDAASRRLYFFRDDTSPNDLQFETIDAAGKITGAGETPYHGDFAVTPPIRVSGDSSKVVIGSGVVFETTGLTKIANLANSFTDAVWTDDKLVTLREIGGVSQLQIWEGPQFVQGSVVRQFNGTPVDIFRNGTGFVVITSVQGAPRFTLLDAAFNTTFISPSRPLSPASLLVKDRAVDSITIQWQDLSDNEDSFRIEVRPVGGDWALGATAPANAQTVVVPGLLAGASYEFRAVAVLGTLVSAPSASASATTLSSPDQPVGEPYFLKATRVYSDRVQVEWQDNATNETGFRIYRSTSSGSLGTQLTAPAGATSFLDTGLTANTLYYYRVQVANGSAAGDLSAQISARTQSSALTPGAPYGLAATSPSANLVNLSWTDQSTNEDQFIIERTPSTATAWAEVARVVYNVTTYADATVVPDTSYSYRIKAINAIGTSTSSSATVKTAKISGDYAGFAMRSGDTYYFAFSGPNRIERYDLISRAWLTPVPLAAAINSLWVDASGIFVAEGRSVVRFDLDGSNRIGLANGDTNVTSIFTLGDTLAFAPSSGNFVTMKKTTGEFLGNFSMFYTGVSYSAAPSLNRVFFRSTNVSPSDILYAQLGADGKLIAGTDSPYHGNYPGATRTFVFPNEARVVDDSGTVYSTDSLTYTNSLGGSFTDLSFFGSDIPVVLRNDKVYAYSNSLLETGSASLSAAGLRVAVSGPDAVVFIADGSVPQGLRIQSVPLSQLATATPGATIDPVGLAYTPDDAFLDKDGNVLLFSKSQLSLFRWSPSELKYTASLPLLGSPSFAAYSKENNSAYFAYASQVVRKMDLSVSAPVESPLFNLPSAPQGFALAGAYPYAATNSGLMTFSPDGAQITSTGFTYYYGNLNVWDPVMRRVYHFRDGVSPNDLHYDTIDAAGAITGGGETPYHGDFNFTKPIVVSPDGSKVLIGSGIVFETTGLTKVAALANTITDGTWFGGKLVTARLISGVTQVQTWTDPTYVAGVGARQITGTPLRLFAVSAQRLLLITLVEGVPHFTLFNEALETIYDSPFRPLPPTGLAATGRTVSSVSLQWQDASENEDGFRVEYRPAAGGAWLSGVTAAANATAATVANLTPGTSYEFRVVATAAGLSSDPSAPATSKTLLTGDEPAGEPYNLRIIQVFANSITLNWADNATNETGFRLLRSTTSGGSATAINLQAGVTSYNNRSLFPGTTYYYRIVAVNGASLGDLSAEVSARTLSADSAPAAPYSLTAASKTATSVSLTWTDNSTNESNMVVERQASGSQNWVTAATLPYNTTSFDDGSLSAATTYTYRVKAVNPLGSGISSSISVTTSSLGGEFAGYSSRTADTYYFAFTGPSRIERYDLASRAWLAPIALDAPATALWVDESGIFVAEDRAVLKYPLAGGTPVTLGNAQATVISLFTVNNVLCFGPGSSLISMDKQTGLFLSDITYYYSGSGYSAAPALNRIFFRSIGVSPSDIHFMEIGSDGKLVKAADSPYHGTYPSASRTFVFPGGSQVADDSGTVYSTDSLSYINSLGGSFTDLSFYGSNIPVVLRDNRLIAYNNALLEAGSFTLQSAALRVAVSGTDALAFIKDGTASHGLKVQVVPLSQLSAPQPGTAVDPNGLSFTPDDVFVDRDGNLLLFSKTYLSLFRWSPQQLKFLPTLPLTGSPSFAGYSKKDHRAYFAYGSQIVRKMDLAAETPVETPAFNLPLPPVGFTLAGEFPYVATTSGLMTFSPDGAILTNTDFTYYKGSFNTWDPVQRRVYHFRDGISPNDLHYDTISTAGLITGGGETPYHGDFSPVKPIVVSPDGSKVVLGSGVVFETTGLTRLTTLPSSLTDAFWSASDLLTVHASGSQTLVRRWNSSTFATNGSLPLFTGAPVRLVPLDAGRSVLITLDRGMPRFYTLAADFSIESDYIPDAPHLQGSPPPATEDIPYSWAPGIQLYPTSGTVTLTAPVLPPWLKLVDGKLAGTPLEADSGDQLNRSKTYQIILRATDSQGRYDQRTYTLQVTWVNDPPILTGDFPALAANDKGEPVQADLGAKMQDPDGSDPHTWTIVGNTNPAIFSSLTVDSAGLLNAVFAPYLSGSSTLTIEVADASGAKAQTSFEISLPELPKPQISASDHIVLSRLTGLYEQTVTITNIAARDIGGFDLSVSGLRTGVQLYNGTSADGGSGLVAYHHPLKPGESVQLVLEYYATPRGEIPIPSMAAVTALPDTQTAAAVAAGAPPFAINRMVRSTDGSSVVLEFNAQAGKAYQIQYSEDTSTWKTCPYPVHAGGTKVQWIDRGAPWTDSPPASVVRRFYRIQSLDQ